MSGNGFDPDANEYTDRALYGTAMLRWTTNNKVGPKPKFHDLVYAAGRVAGERLLNGAKAEGEAAVIGEPDAPSEPPPVEPDPPEPDYAIHTSYDDWIGRCNVTTAEQEDSFNVFYENRLALEAIAHADKYLSPDDLQTVFERICESPALDAVKEDFLRTFCGKKDHPPPPDVPAASKLSGKKYIVKLSLQRMGRRGGFFCQVNCARFNA